MALNDQITSRNTLRDLKVNPANTLQNHRLQVGFPAGHQTQASRVPFAVAHGNIVIGPGAPNNDSRVYTQALVTPTRGRASPNRYTALQRFNGNNVDFWVTERQTGCSLIILDWGAGQMSMGHLEPPAFASYNTVSQFVLNNAPVSAYAETQRNFLKGDVTQLVNASIVGGVNPSRYILVQSNHAPINLRNLNVIGVKAAGGAWGFYMQTNTGPNIAVQQLQWTNWNAYIPYLTY